HDRREDPAGAAAGTRLGRHGELGDDLGGVALWLGERGDARLKAARRHHGGFGDLAHLRAEGAHRAHLRAALLELGSGERQRSAGSIVSAFATASSSASLTVGSISRSRGGGVVTSLMSVATSSES